MQLELDPRWRRLQDRSHVCRCCGVAHGGLFDLSVGQPDYWLDRDGDDRSMLTDDVCVVDGEHCFVRCVAPLPIIGGGGLTFGFGVWSTLSRANFETYVQTADDGRRQGGLGSWFGWFSNQLKGYPDTTGCSPATAVAASDRVGADGPPAFDRAAPGRHVGSNSRPLRVERTRSAPRPSQLNATTCGMASRVAGRDRRAPEDEPR